MRVIVYILCSVFILFWSTTSAAIYIPGLGVCQEQLTTPTESVTDPTTGPTLTYEVSSTTGDAIGRMSVTFSPDLTSITSAEGEVTQQHRRSGVYRALVAQMMADQPQLRTVNAQLNGANLEAYQEAMNAEGDLPQNSINESDRQILAIQTTPLYRVFAPFGFTEIQLVKMNSGEIFVALSKSASESSKSPTDSSMSF